MVQDTFSSIFDSIKQRTTNPFLGTLIIVWLLKNWKLVYSLFYFDAKFTLNQRLNYISSYFDRHSFLLNMLFVVLITVAVLIFTYILLALSRLLSDSYERILMPLVSKWTDSSSIVLKVDYETLKGIIIELEEKLENERLAKAELKSQRDSLDERYVKLLGEVANGNKEEDIDTSTYRAVSNDFKMKGFDDIVDGVLHNIDSGLPVKKGLPVVVDLLDNDFIYVRGSDDEETAFFGFTVEGELFKRYWERISQ